MGPGGGCTPFDSTGRQCLRGRDHPDRGRNHTQLVEASPWRAIGTSHPDGHASGHLWVMIWRYCPEGEEHVFCYLWLKLSDVPEMVVQNVTAGIFLVDFLCQSTAWQAWTFDGNVWFCSLVDFAVPQAYTLNRPCSCPFAPGFGARGFLLAVFLQPTLCTWPLGIGLPVSVRGASPLREGILDLVALPSSSCCKGRARDTSVALGYPPLPGRGFYPFSLRLLSALGCCICPFFLALGALTLLCLWRLLIYGLPDKLSPLYRAARLPCAFVPSTLVLPIGRVGDTGLRILPPPPQRREKRRRKHGHCNRPLRAFWAGVLSWFGFYSLPQQLWAAMHLVVLVQGMDVGRDEVLRQSVGVADLPARDAFLP